MFTEEVTVEVGVGVKMDVVENIRRKKQEFIL